MFFQENNVGRSVNQQKKSVLSNKQTGREKEN